MEFREWISMNYAATAGADVGWAVSAIWLCTWNENLAVAI